MRVGVYIDGYNLYYGGRHQLGKTPGWRWLDLRALVTTLVAEQQSWPGAVVDRIVYCTARIDQSFNPAGFAEQDVCLKALVGAGTVDYIEVDAVIVVSNDSDLKLPIHTARDHVPVGHVNPRGGLFAGDLTGHPSDGAGRHWWRKLTPKDFHGHQLLNPAGRYTRPVGW